MEQGHLFRVSHQIDGCIRHKKKLPLLKVVDCHRNYLDDLLAGPYAMAMKEHLLTRSSHCLYIAVCMTFT